MKPGIFILCFALFCFSDSLHAQPPSGEGIAKYTVNYRSIIPGMPENASLGSYGNVAISTGKGLPQIALNLYSISSGGVTVPISVSYDASGVKFNGVPSSVGQNWSLDAGGSVNRSVNGLADESYLMNNLDKIDPDYMDYQNFHKNRSGVQDTSNRVAEQSLDCSLDYFYYNFPGHGGSMYLGSGKTFRPDKEYKKIKITNSASLDSFVIRDGAGNTYIFTGYIDQSTIYNTGKYLPQSLSSMGANVSWKLKKIITANKQVFNFEYTVYYYEYTSLDSERWTVFITPHGGTYSYCSGFVPYLIGDNEQSFQTTRFVNTAWLVSKISTDDQEVHFNYVNNAGLTVFQKKLSTIKVYSKISADTIKKFSFTYSDDYLASVSETDKDGYDYGKKHFFTYNSMPVADPYSKGRDIFGYLNGAGGNTSLMGNSGVTSYGYTGSIADRYPASEMPGSLTEIKYPTGGRTKFIYESNTEDLGGTTYYAPGQRIKTIYDIDITGKIYHKKRYYYKELVGGYSYLDLVNNNESNLEPTMVDIFLSENSDPYARGDYYYKKVIMENSGNDSSGQTHYEFDYYDQEYNLFDRVSPLLVKQNIYLSDTLHLQKSTRYKYSTSWIDIEGIKSYTLRKPFPVLGNFSYEDSPTLYDFCPPKMVYDGYDLEHYMRPIIYTLDTVTVKEYSATGDSLTTLTANTYTGRYFVQKTTVTGSDNSSNNVIYTYADQLTGNAISTQMSDSFIVAPVVKEQFYVHPHVLKKTKESTYAFNGNGFFTVSNETVTDGPTGKSQTMSYYGYNQKAQPLSLGRAGDLTKSYIWDYLDEMPIAEAINADTSSIAYTSFETGGKGRWSFSGSPAADSTSVTGKKSYNLGGGSITRTGLNSSAYYFVSYWCKSSSLSITGTQSGWPKTLATIQVKGQTWSLYEHKVTGQTTITLSGSVAVDEVRVYPEKAQMQTYTYMPLVGISSQSDANGKIVYYDYDGLNRLVLVRDQYNSILKRICYKYGGQSDICGGTLPPPPPPACNSSNCTGNDKKCINDVCETGEKICGDTFKNPEGVFQHYYHYLWSDGSTSPTYIENGKFCF